LFGSFHLISRLWYDCCAVCRSPKVCAPASRRGCESSIAAFKETTMHVLNRMACSSLVERIAPPLGTREMSETSSGRVARVVECFAVLYGRVEANSFAIWRGTCLADRSRRYGAGGAHGMKHRDGCPAAFVGVCDL